MSTFGAGLLVGTALSVIVPEGVEALYIVHTEKYLPGAVQNKDRNQIISNSLIQPVASNLAAKINYPTYFGNSVVGKGMVEQMQQSPVMDKKETDEYRHSEASVNFNAINQSIGYSLVFGFLFMFLIDQISKYLSSKDGDRTHLKLTATVGLVVHAAADGVAFGSASATNRAGVQFIVFLAIMLHKLLYFKYLNALKAPAAFGLVSFLLVEGIERFRIRRHLIIFSVAAPVAAMVTYYLIVVVENDKSSTDSATGTLMLFSAGTFLYVATVHILPELLGSNVKDYQLVNSATEGSSRGYSESRTSLKLIELISVIVGAISPIFLISSHSHSH
ncbi:unnamed protein product [Wuchereria bancrofti]|uniref:ZIP Zinc transporter n=1 Tax=Wuchereria bancrofti TaxID=6293 RepID=A0A3P7EZK6_WUCBA|nr:unnamed protein product [Wuchereria bancrofti]